MKIRKPHFHRTYYRYISTLLGTLLFYFAHIHAQCFNTVQFPAEEIQVSTFAGDVTLISASSEAGQFCVIKDLVIGLSYTFTSSNPNDFITVRTNGGAADEAPVSSGPSPHTFTPTSHIHEVHINLASPQCGSEALPRTTTIVCIDCAPEPPKTGINTTDPAATLDVNGAIQIADDAAPPEEGRIRYNSVTKDFEGYNGEKWLSLTKSASSWGKLPTAASVEDAKRTANDGAADDNFGRSVAIAGDYAIVGSWFDDVGGNTDQGSAYIFVRSGTSWTQQAKITAMDGAADDRFGGSVSISGDYAIVGASGDDVGTNTNQGSAYVFVRSGTTWTQQQPKLTANDGLDGDLFGTSVAISGDYAIVGASGDNVGGNTDQGSAYVFVRSGATWTQQDKLTANDGAASDIFGESIAIFDDKAIIGARFDDVGSNTNQGSAYVFHRSGTTWSQQDKITAIDGAADDEFGGSVAISNNVAIIGASRKNMDQGAAYVFVPSSMISNVWNQEAKLTANDGEAGHYFGSAVALSGNNAMIGAWGYDVGTNIDQGTAYAFNRSGTIWTQQAKLTSSDGAGGDNFGFSVALSGDDAIIGAYRDDVVANADQGSVYFFCRKQ